jgi:site-specific DNA-methyltransferase (adenine-specific)
MNKAWSDEKLYSHFNLTEEEINFIETIVRPMELVRE